MVPDTANRPVKRRPRQTAAGIPLPRIDQRTIPAMRYRALLDSYSSELGSNPTEPEKALIQQIAAMQLRIEQMQTAIVEGRDVDPDQIIRLSSEHRRLLTALRAKAAKAEPDALAAHLKAKYGVGAGDHTGTAR